MVFMPFIGLMRDRVKVLEVIKAEEFGYSRAFLGGLLMENVWFLDM